MSPGQGRPGSMMLLLFVTALGGCSGKALGAPEDAADSGAATDGTSDTSSTDTTDSDTGSQPDANPAWFALDATLTVAGGFAASSPASARLTVVDADLTTRLCEVDLDVGGLTPGPAGTNDIWLWWNLPVVADDTCTPLPETFALGVGDLVPDLRAQLGAVGLDGAADALFGAYVSADDATTVAFGVAGTEADYAGDGTAARPPADGSYTVQTLFLIPLGVRKQGGGAGP